MKIQFKNINIFNNISKKPLKLDYPQHKKADRSSLNLLSNYNKALIFMGKEIEPVDFKTRKSRLEEKIKAAEAQSPYNYSFKINKENIDSIEALFSSPILYKNNSLIKCAVDTLSSADEAQALTAKTMILTKLLSDKRLRSNINIVKHIPEVVERTDTLENANAKSALIDKILSCQKLYNNDGFMDFACPMIRDIKSDEELQAKSELLDIVANNPELFKNKVFNENFIMVLRQTTNKNQIQVLKKILLNPKFHSNKTFSYNAYYVQKNVIAETKEEADIKCEVLDRVSQDENYYTNYDIMTFLPHILNSVNTNEQKELVYQVFETPRLYNSSYRLLGALSDILNYAGTSYFRDVYGGKAKIVQQDKNEIKRISALFNDEELLPQQIAMFYEKDDIPILEKIRKLNRIIGLENANKLKSSDFRFASDFAYAFNKKDINELSDEEKLEYIAAIIFYNERITETSEEFRKMFPLVPRYQDEYCNNLSKAIESTAKKEPLKDSDIKEFNQALLSLSDKLSCFSDRKFSNLEISNRQNEIISSDKQIESAINKLISLVPEIKKIIDKSGLKEHLKLIQKVAQEDEFKKLANSDKITVLLASLFKGEFKESFEKLAAYSILAKLNLPQKNQTDFYLLVNNQNWLEKITSDKDNSQSNFNLRTAAFDFNRNNLFDMVLILAHARLKAENKMSRWEIRKFKPVEQQIRNLISEFKKLTPIFPITKIPASDRINQAITSVDEYGKTNIKGVYKDSDGLIIINYNEVQNEDWEKIGFSKGSVSRGIKSISPIGENINTGNIKFFAHGLDYNTQLTNFGAFSFADSDVLLSVSYAERPETKYRFFRPQGILLDCDVENVYGGGDQDAGSGFKKTVSELKRQYARDSEFFKNGFISDLIKEQTSMSDDKYVKFVDQYKNIEPTQIQPESVRNKLINILSSINSNQKRKGERNYNEFLISKPKPPMAVYAYSLAEKETINNPVCFLNRDWITPDENKSAQYPDDVKKRTSFLRKYALEHNIPFIVFGEYDEN